MRPLPRRRQRRLECIARRGRRRLLLAGSAVESPTGTGCRCRCPGAFPGSGRGSPRSTGAGRRSPRAAGFEDHPHHLVVAGAPGAHLLVGGVGGVAAGIAHGRGPDARHLPEAPFRPPEAAHAEHRELESVRKRGFEPVAVDVVRVRNGHASPSGPAGRRPADGISVFLFLSHMAVVLLDSGCPIFPSVFSACTSRGFQFPGDGLRGRPRAAPSVSGP